jgi:hypothetical protein
MATQSSSVVEPFMAYFELWKHRARMRFVGNGPVKAYVLALVATY